MISALAIFAAFTAFFWYALNIEIAVMFAVLVLCVVIVGKLKGGDSATQRDSLPPIRSTEELTRVMSAIQKHR